MNCECIYYGNKATEEELMILADKIYAMDCELEPCAISIMTSKTEVTADYDGYNKPFNVPKDSLVLFVYGKYHYMHNMKVGKKVFKPCFPTDYDIDFEDIKEFDDDEE